MVSKEDIKLVAIGIVASAYMTIVYDITQVIAKDPTNFTEVWIKAGAGLLSATVGILIVLYLTRKKKNQ